MKILLTGLPKSGKTTLLTELVEETKLKHGMRAKEEVAEGRRTGFNLVDQFGNAALLARTAPSTGYPVGRFFVDLESLDSFIDHLIDFTPDELLFIDEIGQMQLYSEKFRKLVGSYLALSSSLLSGISLREKCEKLIEQYDKINPLTNAEKQHLYAYALAGIAMELLGGHQEKYINGVDTPETDHWLEVGRRGLKEELLK